MSAADRVLWHKAWTETRAYFRWGVLFLLASAVALYVGYPDAVETRFPNGTIAVGADEARALLHGDRAYVWLSWFGTSLLLGLSFLALAVASPGLVKNADGGASPGVHYALSMPVSRRRLAGVRLAAGMTELFAAAVLSSLLVCLLGAMHGTAFPVGQAVVHALLAACGALALYGLFALLAAMLGELNKAVLGGALLVLCGLFTFVARGARRYSVFRLMTGDTYFRTGEVPWLALAASIGVALALLYASLRVVERRDF
jgi:hypothetical protein